jgi:hypothetical protein
MSIAHVIYSIVTQKKHLTQKNFRHIEIMIFTTFFVNRFFRTRYEKKGNSRYNSQKKFIITHKKISAELLKCLKNLIKKSNKIFL